MKAAMLKESWEKMHETVIYTKTYNYEDWKLMIFIGTRHLIIINPLNIVFFQGHF